jgi:CRISPR system Cascade subunit CasC
VLKDNIGTRTKLMGVQVYHRLVEKGVAESEAREYARAIAGQFGKLKGKKDDKPLNDLEIEQLAHFSPEEEHAVSMLADTLAGESRNPTEDELKLLRRDHKAADVALFGRMLANSPAYNMEAACQVAHAITVHRGPVEDDFFTAVDDLNTREEDAGSAHMGEQGFGAGLFYLYVCIDCDLLKENLQGDSDLAGKAIRALTEAAATVAPTGKQNSFASRAHAFYVLAEQGSRQPRSLSLAFMKPVREGNMLDDAVEAVTIVRANLDKVYYGGKSLDSREINGVKGKGDFRELVDFAADCYGSAS